MKQLQKIQTDGILANLEVKDFGLALYQINLVMAYPLSDAVIEDWAKFIIRAFPKTTPEEVRYVIDKIAKGEIPFDNKYGIRDLAIALKPKTESSRRFKEA